MQLLDDGEAGAVFQPQIEHGEGRRRRAGDFGGLANAADGRNLKPAACERALQARAEGAIVVENEQRFVLGEVLEMFGHVRAL